MFQHENLNIFAELKSNAKYLFLRSLIIKKINANLKMLNTNISECVIKDYSFFI